MKILWHSNTPWAPTGYGNQTGVFVPRLQAQGHEMIVSAFYGLLGCPLNLDGVQILPGSKDPYGNDILLAHRQRQTPDIILALLDHWVINPDLIQALGNYVAWCPVDHKPASVPVISSLKRAFASIAFSKFGLDTLKEAGVDAYYVPHGIDGKVFTVQGQKEARKKMKFPDDVFIAGIVAANKGTPSRKSFNEQIHAFANFHKHHPKSLLYLHTDLQGHQGDNLKRLIELSGLPGEAIRVVDQYDYLVGNITQGYMNNAYGSMDVLMNAAQAEGFGIPIMEAQFCGVPVIVTNWTAMPELCYTGWKVEPSARLFTPQGAYQVVPSQAEIEACLEKAWLTRKQHDRDETRKRVLDYDADNVTTKYWQPVLAQIEAKLKKQMKALEVVTIAPRSTNGKKAPKKPEDTRPVTLSVVVPVYNGKDTIDKALKSVPEGIMVPIVMSSSPPRTEIILVDDDSNDGTWKHIRKYREIFGDNLVTIKNSPGGGPVGAFNAAIPHIRGKYVIKLDADDWFEDGGLAKMVQALEEHPEVGFVYGQCQYHGAKTHLYTPPVFDAQGFYKTNRAIGEVMYRATAHTEHGLVNRGFYEVEGRWFGPHDWDFVLQMIHDLKWTGLALRDTLVHHYMMQTEFTASAQTRAKNANGEIMAKFRERWPEVVGVTI